MTTHRITASILRLRIKAVDGTIIARLPRGTEVQLVQSSANGWGRVRAVLLDGEVEGWVSMAHVEALTTTAPVAEPKWLAVARAEIGVKEYPGAQHNPRVIKYLKSTTNQATSDETAWCSAFVNWCVVQAGVAGTNSAAARSWLKWGRALSEPVPGCMVVFQRGSSPTSGHVAFYLETRGTGILVLGGNQSNSVCVSSYPAGKLLGYRTTP